MVLVIKRIKNSRFIFVGLAVLSIQNIIIYFDHFFNRFGFPWDFIQSYFLIPAFWTSAVRLGIFPQWVPFQSMGYPLFIKAQHGLFYPFFWVFVTFIPFSPQNVAVVGDVAGTELDKSYIGSCTGAKYKDLAKNTIIPQIV